MKVRSISVSIIPVHDASFPPNRLVACFLGVGYKTQDKRFSARRNLELRPHRPPSSPLNDTAVTASE